MKYIIEKENSIVKLLAGDDFDIEQTFECGQCFRWNKDENDVYTGVVGDKIIKVYKDNDYVVLKNTSEDDFINFWSKYFDLDLNYTDIKKNLSTIHPLMERACEFAPGIRLIHQDSWEALVSFIISQNNNIPRIKGIINRLCTCFGEKIADEIYKFPSADVLSKLSVEDLAEIRSGFRAGYIIDAAQKVSSGEVNLENLKSMPLDDARNELMKIRGVGPKVAECTLLYGVHRLECFPMDVWMKRAMQTYFPEMKPEDFGDYAGIAQQYIFHFSRINNMMEV